MPSKLNNTFIKSIPKIKYLIVMKDLKLISPCNMVYKLISKVLVNRLKKVLSIVIHSSQSAFVPYCLITDNAIITFNIFDSMKHRLQYKRGFMALKLNMSKDYDKMEWNFF